MILTYFVMTEPKVTTSMPYMYNETFDYPKEPSIIENMEQAESYH